MGRKRDAKAFSPKNLANLVKESDIQTVLNTNHQFSQIQLTHFSTSISTLTEWDQNLANQIAELTAHRKRIQLGSAVFRAACSGIRRLPNEILASIFVYAAGDRWNCLDIKSTGWRLAQVCRRWRSIALATPQMWSSFRVWQSVETVDDDVSCECGSPGCGAKTEISFGYPRKAQDMLTELIRRSGTSPLSFAFETQDPEEDLDARLTWDSYAANVGCTLLRMLVSQARRWRSITLRLYFEADMIKVLDLAQGKLSLLEKLECEDDSLHSIAFRRLPSDIISAPP